MKNADGQEIDPRKAILYAAKDYIDRFLTEDHYGIPIEKVISCNIHKNFGNYEGVVDLPMGGHTSLPMEKGIQRNINISIDWKD